MHPAVNVLNNKNIKKTSQLKLKQHHNDTGLTMVLSIILSRLAIVEFVYLGRYLGTTL